MILYGQATAPYPASVAALAHATACENTLEEHVTDAQAASLVNASATVITVLESTVIVFAVLFAQFTNHDQVTVCQT